MADETQKPEGGTEKLIIAVVHKVDDGDDGPKVVLPGGDWGATVATVITGNGAKTVVAGLLGLTGVTVFEEAEEVDPVLTRTTFVFPDEPNDDSTPEES